MAEPDLVNIVAVEIEQLSSAQIFNGRALATFQHIQARR
jgi:hypothetical protein